LRTGLFYIFVALWLVIVPSISQATDRCISFIKDVRTEHIKYFGWAYPWWYGVGQLRQESCCRATVTSFDAGQGIAQFMPKTSQYIQSLMGEKLDPYNPKHAIRMQAFYMHRIHMKENWTKKLWIDEQIYNGGRTTLFSEYRRAGVTDWDLMRLSCERKKIKLKSGSILDFCKVNYDYSKKIYEYGKQYRRGPDGISFW